jgi:hypothetical protein
MLEEWYGFIQNNSLKLGCMQILFYRLYIDNREKLTLNA